MTLSGGALLILALGVVPGCGKKSATSESPSTSTSTASYDDDVKELMRVTGSDSVAYQMASYISASIIGSLTAQRRDVTEKQVTAAKQEVDGFLAQRVPALKDSLTGLYKRHYTQDEVRQLIVFFKTPVGVKFATTTPIVAREGSMIGDRWGRELGPELGQRLMARLEKEGLKVR
jgi:hypothetical protein